MLNLHNKKKQAQPKDLNMVALIHVKVPAFTPKLRVVVIFEVLFQHDTAYII